MHSEVLFREMPSIHVLFVMLLKRFALLFSPLGSTDEFVVFQPQLPLPCVAACLKHRTCYAFQQHSTSVPQTAYHDIHRPSPFLQDTGLPAGSTSHPVENIRAHKHNSNT